MKRSAWITLSIAAAALLWTLPANADADVVVRHFDKQFAQGNAQRVLVDVPVGQVIIEGTDERQVHLDVSLMCERREGECAEIAQRVKVVYSTEDDELALRIKEWPKTRNKGLQAMVRVRVPRNLPLEADLGVGELRIENVASDLRADLGVGELSITMPESVVSSVNADTGVGDANLRAGGRRYQSSGLIAKEIRWSQGPGKSHIEADCGVGEISIALK